MTDAIALRDRRAERRGETTVIKRFAPPERALLDFLNADEIARGAERRNNNSRG